MVESCSAHHRPETIPIQKKNSKKFLLRMLNGKGTFVNGRLNSKDTVLNPAFHKYNT